jgi:hypothetical protein
VLYCLCSPCSTLSSIPVLLSLPYCPYSPYTPLPDLLSLLQSSLSLLRLPCYSLNALLSLLSSLYSINHLILSYLIFLLICFFLIWATWLNAFHLPLLLYPHFYLSSSHPFPQSLIPPSTRHHALDFRHQSPPVRDGTQSSCCASPSQIRTQVGHARSTYMKC